MAAGNASTQELPLTGQTFRLGLAGARCSSAPDISGSTVDALLGRIPSQGWVGRRDRALLVLSQIAGLTFESMAELTVADITVRDGVAVIKTPGGRTTLRPSDNALLCAPCALARWLHALDLTVVYESCRISTAVIARAAPLTRHSPHLCQSHVLVTELARELTLLPNIDQYGPLADAATPAVRQPGPARSTAGQIPTQRGSDSPQLPVEPRRLGLVGQQPRPPSNLFDARVRGLQDRIQYLLE